MGLSTALLVPPSSLATTANLIELAKVARQYGGIYSSHGDEGEHIDAIDEAINVGKGANIPVDIIHMKDPRSCGGASTMIAKVQAARDAGFDIRADIFIPTRRGRTISSSIIPPWAFDGGREKMLERLKDIRVAPQLSRDPEWATALVQPLLWRRAMAGPE